MSKFEKLVSYIKLPSADKKKISFKRKYNVVLNVERQKYLFKNYFTNLDKNQESYIINVLPQDYRDIELLLRCYWIIWFERKDFELTLFAKHPARFRITKDVNPQNHWFINETINKNTIMHLGENNYGVVNRLKGLPLKKHSQNEAANELESSAQVNYDYIEAIH